MTPSETLRAALADLARSGISRKEAIDTMRVEALTSAQMLTIVKGPSPPAYVMPYFDVTGKPSDYRRYRFLGSHVPKGSKKPKKYHQPHGEPSHFYFSPSFEWLSVIADPTKMIYIVEGEKKAFAACKIGIPCVGIGGVYNWLSRDSDESPSEAIADFELIDWRGRQVGIVFDSDIAHKQGVRAALKRLRDELVTRGANPHQVVLPAGGGGRKCGLDDFIVENGKRARKLFDGLERRALFIPKAYSAIDIEKLKLRPTEWIIEGLVPRGLAILAGSPKVGKSWMALDFVMSVATGSPALGYFATAKYDTAYLALEDTLQRMKRRTQAVAIRGRGARSVVHYFFDWPRVEEGGLNALERFLDMNPSVKFVLIDTLAKVRPPNSGRGNAYYEDYGALGPIKQIADSRNVGIVVVHHLRKGMSDDPLERISGTTGITGTVDTILILTRNRGDDVGELLVTGRDMEDLQAALSFKDGLWSYLGDRQAVFATTLTKQILDVLVDAGRPLGPTEIADLLGRTRTSLSKVLARLLRESLIRRHDGGKYTPVPERARKF